jgi:Calcium-activated potassium channel, beta subunit
MQQLMMQWLLWLQCSFYPPCRSSRLDNELAVAEYERRYGRPGVDPYPCWYNPSDRSEVIQHRRFRLHHVVNGIVWSSALFIVSIVFLAFVVRRKNFFRS